MTTTPTPSSEIIHLVSTYVDAVDSLPPSLARSLSDLKELDAVLNCALDDITGKLARLDRLMHPERRTGGAQEGEEPEAVTPLDRLRLLRQVAEDARVFRLGGDDKIRVATNTCETVATHSAHLATISNLLLSFLPAHLLPLLPGPAGPHGYPSSSSLSSQIARRQLFDYPPARHPGQGSTARLTGALGMVREHYDLVRGSGAGAGGGPNGMSGMGAPGPAGRGAYAGGAGAGAGAGAGGVGTGGRKRAAQIDYSIYGDDYPPAAGASGQAGGAGYNRRGADGAGTGAAQRHPNQYTKKRAAAAAAAQGGMSPALQQQHASAQSGYPHPGYGGGPVSAASVNAAAGVYNNPANISSSHPFGMTAVEAVKEKRRGAESGAQGQAGQAHLPHVQGMHPQAPAHHHQQQQQMLYAGAGAAGNPGAGSVGPAAMAASASGSRAGSVGIGAMGGNAAGGPGGGPGGAASAGMAYGSGYSGMATPEEYNMAMYNAGQRAPAKRKVDEVAGTSKRRKKTCVLWSDCRVLQDFWLIPCCFILIATGSTRRTSRRAPSPPPRRARALPAGKPTPPATASRTSTRRRPPRACRTTPSRRRKSTTPRSRAPRTTATRRCTASASGSALVR